MQRRLNSIEQGWLEALLKSSFKGRRELQTQIKNAFIKPNYNKVFISLEFIVDRRYEKIPYRVRVPIEMLAYQTNDRPPVQLLLHVIDGYVSELEIFNAGGYEITDKFCLDNVNVIINSELYN